MSRPSAADSTRSVLWGMTVCFHSRCVEPGRQIGLDVQDLDRTAGQVGALDRQHLPVPGQGERPPALTPVGADRSGRPEAQADQDRHPEPAHPAPTSPHRRPPPPATATIAARSRPSRLHQAKGRSSRDSIQPSNGSIHRRDGQADRHADQVGDGVIEARIAIDRGDRLDELGDGRQGQAAQRDPGISPPRGAGPEPEDREDDEDPPVDDLVQVGDLEPGRSLLDFLDDVPGHPAQDHDHEGPERGQGEPDDHRGLRGRRGHGSRRGRGVVLGRREGIHRLMPPGDTQGYGSRPLHGNRPPPRLARVVRPGDDRPRGRFPGSRAPKPRVHPLSKTRN